MDSAADQVARLKESLRRWEGDSRSPENVRPIAPDWDAFAPDGGMRQGSLVECLSEASGQGAETIALAVARLLLEDGGAIVVIDAEGTFYPPAAAALGVDLTAVVLVRPKDDREALWTYDQALRSKAVAAAWGRMERLPGRAYRRLQLSAEEGGTIGFLARSTRTRGQAAWCDWSFVVRCVPCGAAPRYQAEIVRSRDGRTGRSATFEVAESEGILRRVDGDDANPLRVVSALGGAAAPRRRANVRRTGTLL